MSTPSWLWILVAVVLTVAIVGAVLLSTRLWRREPVPADAPGGGRIVGAAIVVGWLFVAGTVFLGAYESIGIISGGWPVPLLTEPYWPETPIPQENIGGVSFVTGGGYTIATASITDLSAEARVWDVIAAVIRTTGFVVAAVVVIRLCRGLRAGRGLMGSGRAFGALSVTALVGGFAWQIAYQLGGMAAARQVALYGVPEFADWPQPAHTLMIDFWPVLPFLAFGAFAAALRHAERLQRDTEGLV